MQHFHSPDIFTLESGTQLPFLDISYCIYGEAESDKPVIWICHALTANADAATWWPGMIGKGKIFDPSTHRIICANILGSCYGSSGPLSVNPVTGKPYYHHFPVITIRDMVQAHILLRKHLGIEKIDLLVGGSMGGYQALEWAVSEPSIMRKLCLLATSATESAWGIAIHTAQRLAIDADPTWQDESADAGKKGMRAARAIGMLTYRNYGIMVEKQTDPDTEKTDDFKASSYILHQGDKLANRFHVASYWLLTKAMDSHNLARGRGGNIDEVLKSIAQPSIIISISSDHLCPPAEQEHLAGLMPHGELVSIDSMYGHDGFMVETEQISEAISHWWIEQY